MRGSDSLRLVEQFVVESDGGAHDAASFDDAISMSPMDVDM